MSHRFGDKTTNGGGPTPVSEAPVGGDRSPPGLTLVAASDIPLAPDEVHLAEWLSTLTSDDFRTACRSHVALAHDFAGGIVTVEQLAGTLIVAHRREELSRPERIRLAAGAADVFPPSGNCDPLRLVWDLTVRPNRDGGSYLHALSEIDPIASMTRRLEAALVVALQADLDEKVRGFAADLRRKYRPLSPRP